METELNEQSEAKKKYKIKLAAGMFFGILLVFTFFSNTLLSLTLPKVLAQLVSQGNLSHNIAGSGMLIPLETVELKSDTSWKVKTLNVKAGDSVAKGQALITFDSKAAELQISNEQSTLKQQNLQLEGLFQSYIEASKNGDPLLIKAAKREVDIQKLQLEAHDRSIQVLQDDLKNNRQMLAPFAGIVTKISATEGVTSPTINLSNRSKGFSFSVTLEAGNAALLTIGEMLQVEVKDKKVKDKEPETKTLEGEITEMEDVQTAESISVNNTAGNLPSKSIRITLEDASLEGGESGSIMLLKSVPTEKETVLVSKSAIHEDESGKYVYIIQERKGTLGNAFYVKRSNIKVVDMNENQAAVQEGIYEMDQIVVESSEPLQDGERVRL